MSGRTDQSALADYTGAMPINVDIKLDRSSPVPLYFQVAEQLETAITTGQIEPGTKISNEVTLASTLGLSRPTMRQAIQLLVDKGMLVRKRGVGTQVVQGRINRPVQLTSLYDDLSLTGKELRTTILKSGVEPATDDVAEQLEIEAGTPVWHLRRLRHVDGKPLAIMENFLPEATVDLTAFDLTDVGLYQALRWSGIHLRVAKQRISARTATAPQARLLETKKGAALLIMTRTAYNDAGTAVEFGRHAYQSELYDFEVTLVDR